MKRKKNEDLCDDEEIPLKNLFVKTIAKTSTQPLHNDELLEYSMETCQFCQAIFHTKYDYYVHLAQHLVIKIPKTITTTIHHKCKNSSKPQKPSKRSESVKILPEKISCKELVVKVENFAALIKKKDELECRGRDKPSVSRARDTENASEIIKARTKLIDEIRSDILKSFVTRSPVVECRDDLAELVKINDADKTSKSPKKFVNGIYKADEKKSNFSDAAVIKRVNYDKDNDVIQNNFIDSTSNTQKCAMNNINDFDTINLIDDDSDSGTDMILSDITRKSEDLLPVQHHAVKNECTKKKRKKSESDTITNKSNRHGNAIIATITKNEEFSANMNNDTDIFDPRPIESDVKNLLQSSPSKLRCRLIFEDDSDDDMMILEESQATIDKEIAFGKIILGNKPEIGMDEVYKSIHYDALQKPGVYFCRHCSKSFPNKYLLISHETSHLKIRQNRRFCRIICHICDYYISGNYVSLRKHIEKYHPVSKTSQKRYKRRCKVCGLKYYDYSNHSEIYHYCIHACKVCDKKFVCVKERDEHLKQHYVSNSEANHALSRNEEGDNKLECKDSVAPEYDDGEVKKICNVCVMFLKNRAGIKYVVMGDYSSVGQKQICDKCHKYHFAVKLVKMCRRKRIEASYKTAEYSRNVVKLKQIKKRFKMLNTMTRY